MTDTTIEPAVLDGAFGLGTFEGSDGSFAGVMVGDLVHDLRPLFGVDTTIRSLLEDWDRSIDTVEAALPDLHGGVAASELRPLPPVLPIGQLLCAGANYYRHVQQIVFSFLRNGGDTRSDEELREAADHQARSRVDSPFMFVGLSSAVCGARDDIVLWKPGSQHDWELELAVVIGKAAHQVDPAHALEHVAGYTISNDVSVRDVMSRPGFPMTDFLTSKNRPTYFPTGPVIVPRRFVPDYHRLRIRLAVNGEVMQDQEIDDIIHGVEECVSYASHLTRLAPGDVILTGSPAGNAGHHGNRWLVPGDLVEASITGLASQRNMCVAPPELIATTS